MSLHVNVASGLLVTQCSMFYFTFHRSPNGKYFALKQIEGTGISMSACREIAVSIHNYAYKGVIKYKINYKLKL